MSFVPHASPLSRGFARVPRLVWHSIGLVIAALIAWAIWRGYQNPDLLLDLGAIKFC
jgi:hypothetical protein